MIDLLEHLIEDFEDVFKPVDDLTAEQRKRLALDKVVQEYPDSNNWPDWLKDELFHNMMTHFAYHYLEEFAEELKKKYPNHWQKLLLMPSLREELQNAVEFAMEMGNFPKEIIHDLQD